MCSNSLHWYQSLIVSLCIPHHLPGVAFNAISSVKSVWFSNTSFSYYAKNFSRSFTPWKLGGLIISIPTHLTVQSILSHLLVETSCSHCCQFSKPISDSVTHEVVLHQLTIPSTVGLT
jgi:hypothetical protein